MPTVNLGRVGFVNKLAWADGVHKINDVVTYNGGTYACILAHTSVAGNIIPTNVTYWIEWINPTIVQSATHAAASKTTPVDADEIPLVDSADSFSLKKLPWANLKATILSSFGVMINTATEKTTPVNADIFIIGDSASANATKKLTWANIVAGIAGTFVDLTNNQTINGIKSFVSNILTPNAAYKPTPVTVTSWSYVTTTITLNVASHTFVVGDYIEVSRLTATTNIPNGVHLVTSVTATTIVFTYALTPTGTAGVSSATVKGYMTTNGRVESIGVGQTWQDVTVSRTLGVTYTNSTGKPIELAMYLRSSSTTTFTMSFNGGANVNIAYASGTGNASVSFVIPSGQTYLLSGTSGIVDAWLELR